MEQVESHENDKGSGVYSRSIDYGDIESLKARAEAGDPKSQAVLAECYLFGFDVQEDRAAYEYWMTNAAQAGHFLAASALGQGYGFGVGWKGSLPLDLHKGLVWLRVAAYLSPESASEVLLRKLGREVEEQEAHAAQSAAEEIISRFPPDIHHAVAPLHEARAVRDYGTHLREAINRTFADLRPELARAGAVYRSAELTRSVLEHLDGLLRNGVGAQADGPEPG